MKIDIVNQQGAPIELRRVVNGVVVQNSPAVPVEVKKKTVNVEPQQQPNVALDIVNKVAFGSGVVILESDAQYSELWMAGKIHPNKWYVLYDEKGDLQRVYMGRKLFARKGKEDEPKTNVFPLVFPIIF